MREHEEVGVFGLSPVVLVVVAAIDVVVEAAAAATKNQSDQLITFVSCPLQLSISARALQSNFYLLTDTSISRAQNSPEIVSTRYSCCSKRDTQGESAIPLSQQHRQRQMQSRRSCWKESLN